MIENKIERGNYLSAIIHFGLLFHVYIIRIVIKLN